MSMTMNRSLRATALFALTCSLFLTNSLSAQKDESALTWPPKLPGGKTVATAKSPEFLKPAETLRDGVKIAKEAPTVDFLYYPVQTYEGHPWSVWGDSLAVGDKYYSAIGDHMAPQGNGYVFEYDSGTKKLRLLVNTSDVLKLPEGHYMPGKIHSRLDMGSDGKLYFATHRGSTRVTTDEYHYKGDWIMRVDPETAETEIVVQGPVPKHCIPTSVLDPDRMIFYGGTAAGNRVDPVMFFAYDINKGKVLHTAKDGPYRYLIFARSTGRVYYVNEDGGQLMRYDPATGKPPQPIPGKIGLRSATQETKDGYVYTVSTRGDGTLYRFNTKTEKIDELGPAAVGTQTYITSLDVDPTGRYLYYSAGAHGGSEGDGTPIVQYDVKTGAKKVICFLFPFTKEHYGYTPIGTFGSALSPAGDKLYVTWNGSRAAPDKRGRYAFDTTAMTVIHIPESER
jgi:sugar lactone lactonase YvrE